MSLQTACNFLCVAALSINVLVGISNAQVEDIDTRNETLPTAEIPQGILQGITLVTRYNRSISGFLGIPYAKPPIGNLRFSSPVPAGNWTGTLDASVDLPLCPQLAGGEEDCLYLNVFRPQFIDTNNSTLIPVMVIIPGGGFDAGNGGAYYYGPGHLLDADLVLVVINYRIGLLGFFSTGDEVAPGNWGMKDQVLALRWVQDNIAYFGGNPDQVTIVGPSAGGASVQLLALSESTTGLFHKCVSQSGTALAPWAVRSRSSYANVALQLGDIVGCPTNTSSFLVDCLRTLNASDLVDTRSQFYEWDEYPAILWGPCVEPDVDGAFLTESPENILAAGKIRDLPSIHGSVKHDGFTFVPGKLPDSELFGEFLDNFDALLPIVLQYPDRVEDVASFTSAIKKFYFNNDLTTNRTQVWYNCVLLFSDYVFIHPAHSALQKQVASAESATFFYSFEYRGTYSINNLVIDPAGTVLDDIVTHADDLLYLYPQLQLMHGILPEQLSEADHKIMDSVVELWTSFAINGTPTTRAATSNATWVAYDSSDDNYLRIGNGPDESLDLLYDFLPERMQFWYDLNTTGSGNTAGISPFLTFISVLLILPKILPFAETRQMYNIIS